MKFPPAIQENPPTETHTVIVRRMSPRFPDFRVEYKGVHELFNNAYAADQYAQELAEMACATIQHV